MSDSDFAQAMAAIKIPSAEEQQAAFAIALADVAKRTFGAPISDREVLLMSGGRPVSEAEAALLRQRGAKMLSGLADHRQGAWRSQ